MQAWRQTWVAEDRVAPDAQPPRAQRDARCRPDSGSVAVAGVQQRRPDRNGTSDAVPAAVQAAVSRPRVGGVGRGALLSGNGSYSAITMVKFEFSV